MSAYTIAVLEITDPGKFKEYQELVPATLEPFGGRYAVRGGAVERFEGDWQPERVVVIEFDNADRARAWHGSEIYAPVKALREACAHTRMIMIEGV